MTVFCVELLRKMLLRFFPIVCGGSLFLSIAQESCTVWMVIGPELYRLLLGSHCMGGYWDYTVRIVTGIRLYERLLVLHCCCFWSGPMSSNAVSHLKLLGHLVRICLTPLQTATAGIGS